MRLSAEESAAPARGRIITFYSYKGGTGRTMLLANVAWILASQGKRVLAVDWDLEAPGLHRYLHPFLIDPELSDTDGVIDMALEYATAAVSGDPRSDPTSDPGEARSGPESEARSGPKGEARSAPEWYERHADVLRFASSLDHEFPSGGTLDLLSAGRQGASYSTRVNTFDWRGFYERQGGGAFLEAVRERMRACYDYVLIDSRTGVSDTSGICTVQMPDRLVVCFTLNTQGIEGAAAVAQSVRSQRKDPSFRIFPVPTRVEAAEKDKLEQRLAFCRSRFAFFPDGIERGRPTEEYWGGVQVPYVPYYAYEEILATVGDRPSQPTSLLAAAERLTGYLTDGAVKEVAPLAEPERLALLARWAPRHRTIPDDELSREAERIWGRLNAEQQLASRRLFTRLVRPGRPDEGRDALVSVPAADVEAYLETAQAFVLGGIVVIEPDPTTSQQVARVGNRALLERWSRLRGWIDEDRSFLAWRDLTVHNAQQWQDSGDGSDLLTGASLSTAHSWASRRGPDLSDLEHRYIAASRRARTMKSISTLATGAVATLVAIVFLLGEVRERGEERALRAALFAAQADSLRDLAPDSALSLYGQAIGLDSTLTPAYLGRAEILLAVPDDSSALDALSDLDRVVRSGPGDARIWALRGDAYSRLERLDTAVLQYDRAVALGAEPAVVFNRGAAHQRLGNDSLAIMDFLRAARDGDPVTREAAFVRLEQLGGARPSEVGTRARIFLHIGSEADRGSAELAKRSLEESGFTVMGIEVRPEPTRGDVRSFHPEDAALAGEVAATVEKGLASTGYPLRLQQRRLEAAAFGNPPRGQIEVWLPSLTGPVQARPPG